MQGYLKISGKHSFSSHDLKILQTTVPRGQKFWEANSENTLTNEIEH